jgi:hypothetical protein
VIMSSVMLLLFKVFHILVSMASMIVFAYPNSCLI